MPVGKHHRRVGMDFAVLQPRHAVVHAAGDLADFGMQRAAEGDVHLLQAAADAEDRHAAGDAGLRQRQRDVVAMDVVGLVPLMRLGLEARRMHIGPRAGQHDAIDDVEQRADVGNLGRAGKHQRQRPRHVGDRAQIALSDHLGLETIFDAIGVPDHTDHGPSHRKNSAVIVLCKDFPG